MNAMMKNCESLVGKVMQNLRANVLEIEQRTDLSDDDKVERILKIFCATCAGVAIQPLPFADFFLLTPLQGYMGSRIAAIRGVPISEEHAAQIVKELFGLVGFGLIGQQLIIGAYKTFIPFLGAISTIPMVYGVTYAIGKLMDEYFEHRRQGERYDPEFLKTVWSKALAVGKKEGKSRKDEIDKMSRTLAGEELRG